MDLTRAEFGVPSVVHFDQSVPLESFAQWTASDLKKSGHPELHRVVVKAQGYKNSMPVDHGDYVYTTVIFDIPSAKIWDVLKLSDSLTYDRLTHELTSRYAGWRTNAAILYLALRMATGHISLEEAKDRRALEKMVTKAARNPEVAKRYTKKLAEIVLESQ